MPAPVPGRRARRLPATLCGLQRPTSRSAAEGVIFPAPGLTRCAMSVVFKVETEQETDGRRLAEVIELPGMLAYGSSEDEALARVQALALRVVADRLEQGEAGREFLDISFKAA